MWSGVVAGLATLSLARLAHAQNVTVNDQQLTYDGSGWTTFIGPQVCAGISQTVHSTSNSGDDVSYSFNGTAVSVHGPTSGSNPMTFVLDGVVQTVAPVVQDPSGCGILYSNINIPDDKQHTLLMVYSAASASSPFQISGITTTGSNSASLATPTVATQVPPPAGSNPANVANSSLTILQTMGANPSSGPTATSESGPNPTSSVIQTSSFVTTPGMTAGVIIAIVGTIVGMLTLLVVALLIRRRIMRQNARKLETKSSDHDLEEGKGHGGTLLADEARFANNTGQKDSGTPYNFGANMSYSPMHGGQASGIIPGGTSDVVPTAIPDPIPPSAQYIRDSVASRDTIPSVYTTRSHTSTHALDTVLHNGPRAAADVSQNSPIRAERVYRGSPMGMSVNSTGSSQLSHQIAVPQYGVMQKAYVVNRTERTGSGIRQPGYF